ncbi:MAG: P-loop NTPase [Deltaproteobacteria bacterium]|nr:P-loop NTPase [Deltaproteobacteria bacterium]
MTKEKDEPVDLLGINVDIGWVCDFRCEDCHRFFDCPSPRRQAFYSARRTEAIAENLKNVKHIIAVMSGKGGVGKSIISANLAIALAGKGYSAAIVDSDLHGPSIPSILGIDSEKLLSGPRGMVPPKASLGVKVVSMDFLTGDDDPVTWLSDLKRNAQELFLANTDYGHLDYLIIDMPPGTGSETVNMLKYLPQIRGVIIVTMSSDVSEQVAQRCIALCRKAKAPIIGLIENMSHLICPHCGKTYQIEHGSSDLLAQKTGVSLLGNIARDPLIVEAADKGVPFLLAHPDSDASNNFNSIVNKIEKAIGSEKQAGTETIYQDIEENRLLKILQINYGNACHERSCYRCTDYFQCTLPKKADIHDLGFIRKIKDAMSGVKHKIAVMSCKGGVGKSTLAANLAVALAKKERTVVILDCDFHGPCIPKMLGVKAKGMKIGKKGIVPIPAARNVKVVSMDFLLKPDEAVTWFDPLKKMTVAQFLYGVDYGNLDYLIVDLPPGTGGESYALLQCLPDLDGAVIITLPSESPQAVTRRSMGLCRQANVPIIGIIENMSRFVCAGCRNISKMYGTKETADFASATGIPLLGDIPLDSNIFEHCDEGIPFVVGFPESIATGSVLTIAGKIREFVGDFDT